ncbi:MAG: hypothetical protein ACRC0G_16765 [Fusobacteriaceae bacterium]
MSNYCSKCKILVPKHVAKDNKCSCGNNLKYIGRCGECLDFLEFYGGIGICSNKDRVKSTDEGCEQFK